MRKFVACIFQVFYFQPSPRLELKIRFDDVEVDKKKVIRPRRLLYCISILTPFRFFPFRCVPFLVLFLHVPLLGGATLFEKGKYKSVPNLVVICFVQKGHSFVDFDVPLLPPHRY